MALQDLERGNGFALIDPHGDLVAHGILHRAARVHRPAKQRSGVAVRGAVATVSDAGDRLRQQREAALEELQRLKVVGTAAILALLRGDRP
jgi:hypothetical protein